MAESNVFDRIEREHQDVEPMSQWERLSTLVDLWFIAPVRIIWEDRRTRVGVVILAFYVLMGTLGTHVVDVPRQNEGETLIAAFETWQFPLGTDGAGRGILELTVHATPGMLLMAFAGSTFSIVIGTIVGTLAGYKRGPTERVLMTATDIQIGIPGLPLLIVLAMALEPRDPIVIGIILSVGAWAGLARSIHSQVLALRSKSYVEASRVLGLGSLSIIRGDVLPNIMPYILINFMQNTTQIIHASVALYFLSVLPFSYQNWGVMLNEAYNSGALLSWRGFWWLTVPIVAITLLSFGVTLLAQGMDRLFNPRVRARHTRSESGAGSAEVIEG